MAQVRVNVLKRELALDQTLVNVLGVISFTALTIAGAYIRIPLPFTPVPLTLQTFFVLLAGAMLGRRLGPLSQAIYLLVGIFGLPVFTGGLYGVARLFGPTGGYLIGFVLAAYVIGRLLEGDCGFVRIAAAMLLGDAILLSAGTVQLAVVLHLAWKAAFMMGFAPFLIGDGIKLLAAATVYQKLQKTSRAAFGR